jgi:serine/threonine protein kinase, bacterial
VDLQEISGYEVIRQLGAGGMGQVFLVQHPRLPRRDAMKLLDPGVSRNDEFKTRFRREANLLSQLSHHNIVTLFDRGEFEGRLWITMEYIDGTDAAALTKTQGPLPVPLVLALVDGAGAALDHAWRKQRITHRDVKPANILVALNGTDIDTVKLADFGIAKAAGESTSLTSTGITIGTVNYLSPEAIEGLDLDNRADIYSLGCTAFELLTGTTPFSGNSITAVMSAHLTRGVPDVTDRVPELPHALNAVFAKALAKKPDDRYQSCAEFAADLRAASHARDRPVGAISVDAAATMAAPTMASPQRATAEPSVPSSRPSRRRRAVIVAAAVTSVLVIAAIGVALRNHQWATGQTGTPAAAPSSSVQIAPSTQRPAPGPPTTSPAEPTTTTTPEVSKSGFYGEWSQHATSVTLSPNGTARYAVSAGAMYYTAWSATWSAENSTTALIVLDTQQKSELDPDYFLVRHPGQSFTFTLRSDGYAEITDPKGQPIVLCPNTNGYSDPQHLCGA